MVIRITYPDGIYLAQQHWVNNEGVGMSAIIFKVETNQTEIFEKGPSKRWIRSTRARNRRKEMRQIRDQVLGRYYSKLKHLRQKHQKINARQHHSEDSDLRN